VGEGDGVGVRPRLAGGACEMDRDFEAGLCGGVDAGHAGSVLYFLVAVVVARWPLRGGEGAPCKG